MRRLRYPCFDQCRQTESVHADYAYRVISVTYKLTDDIVKCQRDDAGLIKYRINIVLDDLAKIATLDSLTIQSYDIVCVLINNEEELRKASEYHVDLLRVKQCFLIRHTLVNHSQQNNATLEVPIVDVDADFFNRYYSMVVNARRRNVCFTAADHSFAEICAFAREFFGVKREKVLRAYRRVWHSMLARRKKFFN